MRRTAECLVSSLVVLATALVASLFLVGCATEEDSAVIAPAPVESWAIETVPPELTLDEGQVIPGQSEKDGGVVIQAGCSIVEWCNAPGADGSRCKQQGCTLTAAISECESETRQFCGTPQCPWIFVALDGTRYTRTPCP